MVFGSLFVQLLIITPSKNRRNDQWPTKTIQKQLSWVLQLAPSWAAIREPVASQRWSHLSPRTRGLCMLWAVVDPRTQIFGVLMVSGRNSSGGSWRCAKRSRRSRIDRRPVRPTTVISVAEGYPWGNRVGFFQGYLAYTDRSTRQEVYVEPEYPLFCLWTFKKSQSERSISNEVGVVLHPLAEQQLSHLHEFALVTSQKSLDFWQRIS